MEPLILKPTEDTPQIILDLQNDKFEISGRSLPEDVEDFYIPVFAWLNNFPAKAKIHLDIKMVYFNTASSKLILDILCKLQEIKEAGSDVKVNWHYETEDIDMLEAGEEYAEMVEIEFNLIKI